MTFMILVVYLVIYCIWGSIWGLAVNKIIENKGYRENWFWWGFFFGMIALLVALTKPDLPRTTSDTGYIGYKFGYSDRNTLGENYVFKGFGHEKERKADYTKGEWRCTHCGKVNASYVGTCGCGWDKSGNAPKKGSGELHTQTEQSQQPQMLYCTSCGKQMEADSKFCRYCGAKVG